MSQDLSLVLEDDMWEELCKRYDGVVLVTFREVDSKFNDTSVNYHGGKPLCVGLCEHVKDVLLSDMKSNLKKKENE